MEKQTVRDFDPQGKRVLVRVDFNVPIEDGRVKDDSRIRAALPTINYLLEHGASVVLMSHLGRPKGKVVESMRLTPMAGRLKELSGFDVVKLEDCVGAAVRSAIDKAPSKSVVLLENVRFHAGDETCDAAFSKELAQNGDVFVNDAFGSSHRDHCSVAGVARILDLETRNSELESDNARLERWGRSAAGSLRPARGSARSCQRPRDWPYRRRLGKAAEGAAAVVGDHVG